MLSATIKTFWHSVFAAQVSTNQKAPIACRDSLHSDADACNVRLFVRLLLGLLFLLLLFVVVVAFRCWGKILTTILLMTTGRQISFGAVSGRSSAWVLFGNTFWLIFGTTVLSQAVVFTCEKQCLYSSG